MFILILIRLFYLGLEFTHDEDDEDEFEDEFEDEDDEEDDEDDLRIVIYILFYFYNLSYFCYFNLFISLNDEYSLFDLVSGLLFSFYIHIAKGLF